MPSEIQMPPRVPGGAGALGVGAGVVADGPGSVGSSSSDRLSTEQAPENIEAMATIASRVLVLFMIVVSARSRSYKPVRAHTKLCVVSGKWAVNPPDSRLDPDGVQEASQIIVECVVSATEGEIIPRNGGNVELSCFKAFVVGA